MKKSLLFAAAALFLSSPCILADDETTSTDDVTYLTSLSDVDTSKSYYVTTDRAQWVTSADASALTTSKKYTDATDDEKKFTFVKGSDDNYYLYSVSAKKFLCIGNSFSTTSADPIQFNDGTGYNKGENTEYRVQVQFVGSTYFNVDSYGSMLIDGWSTVDGGNACLISEAASFDGYDEATKLLDYIFEIGPLASLIETAQTRVAAVTEGTGLGQYSNVSALSAAIETAQAIIDNNEKITEEAINTLQAAIDAVTINTPERGKFYRFKNKTSNQYLGNTNNESNLIYMVEDSEPNSFDDVLYLDEDGRLVSFATGLCLGNFGSGDKANSWRFLDKDNSKTATGISFVESGVVGYYNIYLQSNRTLNGAVATTITETDDEGNETSITKYLADAGGNDGGDGWRWTISEVAWLPVPMDVTVGYTTICSPIALGLGYDSDRVAVYTVEYTSEGSLYKDAVSGNIPANTPVLLQYLTGIENGCVYLPTQNISGGTVSGNTNSLKGDIYQQTVTETSVFVPTSTGFAVTDETTVAGFTAYLPVATTATATSLTFSDRPSTGINEVTAAEATGAIYDLQGRRVANASNGIYIINGKKVLVK